MPTKVAIIGRPNVGKSTLFNRLCGKRLALVDDRPGVTRDRREGDAQIGGLKFTVFDTAGLDDAPAGSLEGRMRDMSRQAIARSDICLFMIDARSGVTPMDKHFAEELRKSGKPVIVLANKAEGKQGDAGIYEAFSLGLGEPIALSAAHGIGIDELHDALEAEIGRLQPRQLEEEVRTPSEASEPDTDETTGAERPLRLAILGRPNAGKSTLVNTLIGEERMLTGPEAGITRDAISIDWSFKGRPVKLWDTAGVRKRSRVTAKLEKLAVADGLRAVQFAEVVVLLLDATIALEKQDLSLADHVAREGRAMVIAVNKWDLVSNKQAARRELDLEIARLLPQLAGVEVVTLSAKTGHGVKTLMPAVMKAYDTWNRRVSTAKLNQWLAFQVERHPPPAPGGRRIKLRYITQVRSRPPSFAVFCSRPEDVPDSYKRYLVNGLREDFGLTGVPLRIHLRKGKNPYAD